MCKSPRCLILKNFFPTVGILFILASSIFLGVAFSMFVTDSYFHTNGVLTEAVIEEAWPGNVRIQYSAGEDSFSGLLGFYNSSMREGGTIFIYYDAGNPGRIHAVSSGPSPLIFMTFGLLLLIFGGAMAGSIFVRQKQIL